MLFVIDVGNSHTVTGLFAAGHLVEQYRLKSDRERTSDELAIRYHSLFSMAGIDPTMITGIVLASVVPSLQATWIKCCHKYFSSHLKNPLFVVTEQSVRNLITITMDHPQDVGSDRLVNAISGWYQHKCSLIIVDFGTAITFDCITHTREYIGGTILPGIGISMEALSSQTAKLPHIDISDPPKSVIGSNTVKAMKSGVTYGYGSLVDGLVDKIKKEMNEPAHSIKVIATGGMARVISPYTKCFDLIDPELTLRGLQIIYEKTNTND